jgi:hypothetical protein
MAGKARVDLSRLARWWRPFTIAGTVALVVVAVTVPWTPWPADDFGHAPWWVWGPLVTATVLFVVGLGERKHTAWATAAAGVAMVAAVVSLLAWPGEEVVLDGRTHERIRERPWPEDVPPEWWLRLYPAERPAALLTCTLAAAVLLALGVVMLVRRLDPWTVPDAEPGTGSGPVDDDRLHPTRAARRQARKAMATGLVGVLVGGLLGAGTAYGAGELRMATVGPWWGPLADSVPVPEERLHEGAVEWDGRKRFTRLPDQPTRVAWQHDFAGPVALSTCGRDGRARATLVALEESAERSVVVGHDAKDGTLRWSLTVHRRDTARLSQVAVGEGCSVLVLIGTILLAVDAYTGRVGGSSVLPQAHHGAWHFITPAPEEYPLPRLVGLHEADYAHLTAWDQGIAAVRRSDAELVAWGARRPWGCTYAVDYYRNEPASGHLLMDGCGSTTSVAVLPGLETPEELRTERPPAYRLPHTQPLLASVETPIPEPPPGCRSGPLRIRSASAGPTLVETEMDCAGTRYLARISLQHDAVLDVLTRDVVDGHAASRVIGGRPPRAEWARRVL